MQQGKEELKKLARLLEAGVGGSNQSKGPEFLQSGNRTKTRLGSPSGNIAVRVAPQDLNKFLDFAGKQGKIAQDVTESKDKTAAVVVRLLGFALVRIGGPRNRSSFFSRSAFTKFTRKLNQIFMRKYRPQRRKR